MSTWIQKKPDAEDNEPPTLTLESLRLSKEKESVDKGLLILVLDISPDQGYLKDDSKALFKATDAFITFGNSHCLLDRENEVVLLASNVNQTYYCYPAPETPNDKTKQKPTHRQVDGQFEGFLEFETTVRSALKAIMQSPGFYKHETVSSDSASNGNPTPGNTSSSLANSLGRALCYVNRRQKEILPEYKLNARVCVLTGSPDSGNQYLPFMNSFCVAQRMGVTIDACVLGKETATVLSQGCDMTGGIYFQAPQGHVGLMQHLLWTFLPDKSLRGKLSQPPSAPVDYRSACFCHRKLISIGWVCTSCLSIYCKYAPICTTCQ